MSHQVLARKWRPRRFDQLVGQEHVVRALSNALTQGRLHHAYLFTGTRGVGKTTLARILAKCLNCETGVSAEPCGVCGACAQIEAGRFVDLIELDAASNTGVDNMREILENAQYAPTTGRYKVYIIDEVHMLSKSAFNAMLKTLEEPPGHVIFILATTDPQKVPVTVLSRCLQFNLKQMAPAHVAGHLRQVLEAENVPFDSAALQLLARAAAGSMRDALSLADQAIAHGGGEVREADTRAMLGVIDQAYLLPLLEALAAGDGPSLLAGASELAAHGYAFDAVLQDFAGLLHQIALARTVPEAVAEDVPARERLFDLARRFDPEHTQLYYQIATLGRRDLEWAPDEFAGFSMTLLRMLAFAPGDTPAKRAVDAPDRPAASARAGAGTGNAGIGAARRALAQPIEVPAANEALVDALPATDFSGEPAASASQMSAVVTDDRACCASDWRALAESLPGLARQLAMQCEQIERGAAVLRLRLPDSQKALLASVGDKLRALLGERLGPGMRIDIELGAASDASPAAELAREATARQSAAEVAIRQDPFVLTFTRECDATVSNIRPRAAG